MLVKNFTIPEQMFDRLQNESETTGLTMSEIVRRGIDLYFNQFPFQTIPTIEENLILETNKIKVIFDSYIKYRNEYAKTNSHKWAIKANNSLKEVEDILNSSAFLSVEEEE